MNIYVILLRGINVGGKNKVSMVELKHHLEELGFSEVITFINSGNVIVQTKLNAKTSIEKIEGMLPKKFNLDSSIIRIAALDHKAYKKVLEQAPKEFGKDNENYRYYVLFLMGVTANEAMKEIDVREGVDAAWQGDYAIYYRLPSLKSPNATKSYLNKVAQKPLYQFITIRNWNTTTKLLELLEKHTS